MVSDLLRLRISQTCWWRSLIN